MFMNNNRRVEIPHWLVAIVYLLIAMISMAIIFCLETFI